MNGLIHSELLSRYHGDCSKYLVETKPGLRTIFFAIRDRRYATQMDFSKRLYFPYTYFYSELFCSDPEDDPVYSFHRLRVFCSPNALTSECDPVHFLSLPNIETTHCDCCLGNNGHIPRSYNREKLVKNAIGDFWQIPFYDSINDISFHSYSRYNAEVIDLWEKYTAEGRYDLINGLMKIHSCNLEDLTGIKLKR